MKASLLAAAVLTAAVLTAAGAAAAQQPFTVRIGGDAYFEAAAVSQSRDAGARATEFAERFRFDVTASAKTDAGLGYGARLRLRVVGGPSGVSAANDYDRAYLFMEGPLGSLRLGVTNSFNDEFNFVARPLDYLVTPLPDTGVDFAAKAPGSPILASSPVVTNIAALTLTDNARGSKLVWFSPRVAGLRLGASYTPQPFSHGLDIDRAKNAAPGFQDVWEAGAHYAREFGGFGVAASFAYMAGRSELASQADLASMQAGLSFSYNGLTLGGGYVGRGDSGLLRAAANRSGLKVWNAGAQYQSGPWSVGLGYVDGRREGDQAVAADDRQRFWSAGLGYMAAPGLRFGAEFLAIRFDDEAGAAKAAREDDQARVGLLRATLAF